MLKHILKLNSVWLSRRSGPVVAPSTLELVAWAAAFVFGLWRGQQIALQLDIVCALLAEVLAKGGIVAHIAFWFLMLILLCLWAILFTEELRRPRSGSRLVTPSYHCVFLAMAIMMLPCPVAFILVMQSAGATVTMERLFVTSNFDLMVVLFSVFQVTFGVAVAGVSSVHKLSEESGWFIAAYLCFAMVSVLAVFLSMTLHLSATTEERTGNAMRRQVRLRQLSCLIFAVSLAAVFC